MTEGQQLLLDNYRISYENEFHISYKEVINWYVDGDILCFASTYEGFGLPIIEAQLLGIPVVTSNVGAMREVAGNSACLVDPSNEVDIRYGVVKVISDEQYRKDLIEKGLKNIQRFEPTKIAQMYEDVYREVLE